MNRRQLLQTAMAGSVGVTLAGIHRACLADADFDAEVRNPVLTTAQREMIATISELVIPETETPGAIEAGVPQFIELLLSDWYTAGERLPVVEGLEGLDARCLRTWQTPFVDCDPAVQTEQLTAVQDSVFFNEIKALTVYGYYTSEVGANAELVFNPVPGRYTTIEFRDVGRQWVQ